MIKAKLAVKILILYAITLLDGGPVLAAATEQQRYNYPGGVVEIMLPKKADVLPQVKYGTHEPVIIQRQDHWRILIGLSLVTLPGEYVLYVKESESERPAYAIKFEVTQKTYPFLEVAKDARPSNIQYASMSDLDFSNTEQPQLPLIPPLAGQWADFFGHVVTSPDPDLNSSEVVTQNYVSLTTTELATVKAPQNAIVSRVVLNDGPLHLATVFLDHGRGLYSIISGLTDLSVETGNGIIAGAVIGKLPANPDTPSELIWQCLINGVYINPLIMTQL